MPPSAPSYTPEQVLAAKQRAELGIKSFSQEEVIAAQKSRPAVSVESRPTPNKPKKSDLEKYGFENPNDIKARETRARRDAAIAAMTPDEKKALYAEDLLRQDEQGLTHADKIYTSRDYDRNAQDTRAGAVAGTMRQGIQEGFQGDFVTRKIPHPVFQMLKTGMESLLPDNRTDAVKQAQERRAYQLDEGVNNLEVGGAPVGMIANTVLDSAGFAADMVGGTGIIKGAVKNVPKLRLIRESGKLIPGLKILPEAADTAVKVEKAAKATKAARALAIGRSSAEAVGLAAGLTALKVPAVARKVSGEVASPDDVRSFTHKLVGESTDKFIEYLSEMMGTKVLSGAGELMGMAVPKGASNFGSRVLGGTAKQLGKIPGAGSVKKAAGAVADKAKMVYGLKTAAAEYMAKKTNLSAVHWYKEFTRSGQWHGPLGEMLEERYGEGMRWALDAVGLDLRIDNPESVSHTVVNAAQEYLNNNPEEAWNQITKAFGDVATEYAAFMVPGMVARGQAAYKRTVNRLSDAKAKQEVKRFDRSVRKEFEKVNEALEKRKTETGNKAGIPHGTAFVGPGNDLYAVEGAALVHYDEQGNRTGEVHDLDSEPSPELIEKLNNYDAHPPGNRRSLEEIDQEIASTQEAAQSWMPAEEFGVKYDKPKRERRAVIASQTQAPPEGKPTQPATEVKVEPKAEANVEAPKPESPKPEAKRPKAEPKKAQEPVVSKPADLPEGGHAPGSKVRVRSHSGKDLGEAEIAGYEEVEGKTKVVFKKPLTSGQDRGFIEGFQITKIGDEVGQANSPENATAKPASPAQPQAEVPPAEPEAAKGPEEVAKTREQYDSEIKAAYDRRKKLQSDGDVEGAQKALDEAKKLRAERDALPTQASPEVRPTQPAAEGKPAQAEPVAEAPAEKPQTRESELAEAVAKKEDALRRFKIYLDRANVSESEEKSERARIDRAYEEHVARIEAKYGKPEAPVEEPKKRKLGKDEIRDLLVGDLGAEIGKGKPTQPAAEAPKAEAPRNEKKATGEKKIGAKKSPAPPKTESRPQPKTGNAKIDDLAAKLRDKFKSIGGPASGLDSLKSIPGDMGAVPALDDDLKNLLAPTGMRKGLGDWYEWRPAHVLDVAQRNGSKLSQRIKDGVSTWTLKGPKGDLVLTQKAWTNLGDILDQLKATGAMSAQEEEFLSKIDRSLPVSLTGRGSDTSNPFDPGGWNALWHRSGDGVIHMSIGTMTSFSTFITTLSHEVWHDQTAHAVNWILSVYGKADPSGVKLFTGWQNLSDEELNAKLARLKAPVANLLELYARCLTLADEQKESGAYTVSKDYWKTSIHEFIAEAGSNRSLQDWMARQNFGKRLGGKGLKSFLDRFVEIICEIVGIHDDKNLLYNVLNNMAVLAEEQKSWKRTPGNATLELAHRDPRSMDHKKVTERIPELTEAAKAIRSGDVKMTREIYDTLVNKFKPIYGRKNDFLYSESEGNPRGLSELGNDDVIAIATITSEAVADESIAVRSLDGLVRMFRSLLGDKITLHLAPGIEFAWKRVATVYDGDFSGVEDTVAATMRNQDTVKDQQNVSEDAKEDSAGSGESGVPDGADKSDADASEVHDEAAPGRDSEREANPEGAGLPGDPGAVSEGNADSGRGDGRGTGESGVPLGDQSGLAAGEPAREGGEEAPARVPAGAVNHVIEAGDVIVPGGAAKRARANVEAIKLLKKLEEENRFATPEEKKVLAQFTGWGALTTYFDEGSSYNRNRPAFASWKANSAELYDEIKELLSEEEWQTAFTSTANAHYTSKEMTQAIWKIAEHLGFKGGRYLEPGAGIGNFAGLMPELLRPGSKGVMVEMDALSSRLLKKLYPENDVIGMDMADAKIAPHSVDIAIGNVPFGDIWPHDSEYRYGIKLNVHNYFIARSIDAVKPGGLVMVVTSHHTMDSRDEQAKFLSGKADLIGAIRLPKNAFSDNAGTQVVTDIVIFRKPLGPDSRGESWTGKANVTGKTKTGQDKTDGITEYYESHPEMVLGKHAFTGSMYRADEYSVEPIPGELIEEQVAKALLNLPKDILADKKAEGAIIEEEGDKVAPEGTLDLIGDKLHVINKRVPTEIIPGKANRIEGYPARLFTAGTQDVAKSYIAVRNALRNVVDVMLNGESTDQDVKDAQAELNREYDNFAGVHGYVNFAKNIQSLEADPEFYRVMSIENVKAFWNSDLKALEYKVTKGDIFSKRVLGPKSAPMSVPTVRDAILVSMGYRGRIELGYVSALAGVTEEEAVEKFASENMAFRDPVSGEYILSDLYLSGNVRNKLLQAQIAVGDSKEYERNVKALEAVQPERVSLKDVHFRLGDAWIPVEVYQEFARTVFNPGATAEDTDYRRKSQLIPVVEYQAMTENYVCKRKAKDKGKDNHANDTEYSVTKGNGRVISGLEVLQYALNLAVKPKITYQEEDADGTKRTINDDNASAEVALQIDRLQTLFKSFVMTPGSLYGEMVEESWNTSTNHTVELKHTGAHINLPGASSEIVMREYQKAAIARFILEGSGMLAHAVGAGKTYTLIGTAMEMRRLGMAKRPVIVVQNATLGQFSTSFMKMYPGANVLVATTEDLGAGRHQFLARMQTGDWDAVVMAQSTFDMLEVSDDAQKAYIDERFDELQAAYAAAMRDREPQNSPRVRDIRNALTKLRDKLKALKDKKKKAEEGRAKSGKRKTERLIWEDLGVDALLVDEAHAYKKPPFVTKLGQIVGLQKQVSSVGEDIFMKVRQVQASNKGRGVIFATGTPVTNTMGEIWHMMNFVNPKKNREFGVRTFDEFVSKFALNAPMMDYDASGQPIVREGLTRFINGPEFVSWFRSTFDILTPDELREYLTELDADGKPKQSLVPGMKGGDIIKVVVPSNSYIEEFQDYILETYDAYKALTGKEKKRLSWVPISLFSAGKYIGLDVRLLYPKAKEQPGGKVQALVSEAMREYRESSDRKGTQLIFSDVFNTRVSNLLETWAPNPYKPEMSYEEAAPGGAFLFRDIKKKLMAAGVPESEIEIVDDHDKEDREALFDRVKQGEVRFIMGSTETLGTGVNVQDRVTAIHHLETPWMPASLEQRNGRGLRFGNINYDRGVGIYMYATENTLDSAIIKKVVRKAKGIHQIMGGRLTGREFDDPTAEVALSMEEMAAIAEGNESFFRKLELDKRRRDLEMAREGLLTAQTRSREYIKHATADISSLEAQVKNGEETLAKFKAIAEAKPEKVVIDGKAYNLEDKAEAQAAQDILDTLMRELRVNVEAQTKLGSLPEFTVNDWSIGKPPIGNSSKLFSISGLEVRYVYGGVIYKVNGEKKFSGRGRFSMVVPGESQNIYTGEAETAKGLVDGAAHIVNVVENNIREAKESIDNKREEMDRAKTTLTKTWDGDAELKSIQGELVKVDADLVADAKAKAEARAARRAARGSSSKAPKNQAMRRLGKTRLAQQQPSNLNNDPYDSNPKVDVSEAGLLARWSEMFDVTLQEGYFSEKAQGIYKFWLKLNKGPGIVRMKPAHFNIYVGTHEIAHHIDANTGTTINLIDAVRSKIGYDSHGRPVKSGQMQYTAKEIAAEIRKLSYVKSVDKKTMLAEGWAEMIRHYITEDDLQVIAPKAYDWLTNIWMRDNYELAQKLKDARTEAHEYKYQGLLQRARSIFQPINHGQPWGEWWNNLQKQKTTQFMDKIVDDTYMVGKIDERLLKSGYDPRQHNTASLRDFMIGYNMTARARAAAALEVGVFSVRLGEQKQLGQAGGYWQGVREAVQNDEEYAEACTFALARHTIYLEDVAKVDFNPGMTVEQARLVYAEAKKNKDKFARYEQFAKHLANYCNDQLNMLVDAGSLSSKDRDNMVKFYGDHYFPLHRQTRPVHSMFGTKEEAPSGGTPGKYVNLGKPVKSRSATGSTLPIFDPSVAVMERSVRFYDRAAKTRVIHHIIGRLDPALGGVSHMGDLVDRVPPRKRVTKARLKELLRQLVDSGIVDKRRAKLSMIAWKILRSKNVNIEEKKYFKTMTKMKGSSDAEFRAMAKKLPNLEAEVSIWRDNLTPNAKKATVIVHDLKGKPVMYQIDQNLYEVLTGMDEMSLGMVTKLFSVANSMFRTGAINLNPAFGLYNITADMPNYMVSGKDSTWYNRIVAPMASVLGIATSKLEDKPVVGKLAKMMAEIMTNIVNKGRAIAGLPGIEGTNLQMVRGKNDAAIRYYELLGGGLYTQVGGSYQSHQRTVRRQLFSIEHKQKGYVSKGQDVLDTVAYKTDTILKNMQEIISVTDMFPRLAQFIATMKAHGYHPDGDHWVDDSGAVAIPPEHVQISAIVAAGNSTTNFKVAGRWGRKINTYLSLWNPAVQATYRWVKLLHNLKNIRSPDDDRRLEAKKTIFMMLATSVSSMLFWLFRHEDSDYQNQTPDVKEKWLTLGWGGKTHIKVAKVPMDHNGLVWNLTAAGLDLIFHDDKDSRVGDVIWNFAAENALPTGGGLGRTSIEVFVSDYDYYRRTDLTPSYLQNSPKELQFTEYTLGTSKLISSMLGHSMSPIQVDHFMNGLTGGMYRRLMDTVETVGSGEAPRLNQLPLLRGMLPDRHAKQPVNDLYDRSGVLDHLVQLEGATQEDRAEKQKLDQYIELMHDIRALEYAKNNKRRNFEYEGYLVGLANEALDRRPQADNPAPYGADVPGDVKKVVFDFSMRKAKLGMMMSDYPRKAEDGKTYQETVQDYQARQKSAETWLASHSQYDQVYSAIKEVRKSKGFQDLIDGKKEPSSWEERQIWREKRSKARVWKY